MGQKEETPFLTLRCVEVFLTEKAYAEMGEAELDMQDVLNALHHCRQLLRISKQVEDCEGSPFFIITPIAEKTKGCCLSPDMNFIAKIFHNLWQAGVLKKHEGVLGN